MAPPPRRRCRQCCSSRAALALLALPLLCRSAAALAAAAPPPPPDPRALPAARKQAADEGIIAFVSNSSGSFQVWTMLPDSSQQRQLTSPGGADGAPRMAVHPSFSPDGSLVAFSGMGADGALNVWVIAADGAGGARRLTDAAPPHNSYVPAFAADGARIYFESNIHVPASESNSTDPYDIYSVDASTGGDLRRVTATPGGRTSMGAKPSPDGRWLAFASDRGDGQMLGLYDLWVSAINGSDPRRLTTGAANQYSRGWSPDSKQIVFNSQVAWASDRLGAGRIMAIKLRPGSKPRRLTKTNDRYPGFSPGGPFPTLRGDVTPAWSPDGKRVAYCGQAAPGGGFEVFTVKSASGGGARRLTNGAGAAHVTLAWGRRA